METEGPISSCLSIISNEDGTVRKDNVTEACEPSSSDIESNILHTVKPTVSLYIEMEGTGSSIVGISNGESITPLYSIQFRHHSTVKLRMHLKENKQQVKATFNDETSTICVDQQEGVKLDIKIYSGSFNIVLAQNGKAVMKLKTEGFDIHQPDVRSESCVPDNDYAAKTADDDKDDDKDDDSVNTKEIMEQNEVQSHLEIQCSLQPITENTTLSSRSTNSCTDNRMIELNEIYDATESINEEIEESFESINNKESELNGEKRFLTGERRSYTVRTIQKETVDIRTHRVELLTRMNAKRLVNYFFQAELISEADMDEINETQTRINANERLLKILRNRNVSRQEVSKILRGAEEEHLIEYMFPNEVTVKTVSTQTEYSLDKDQTRSGL